MPAQHILVSCWGSQRQNPLRRCRSCNFPAFEGRPWKTKSPALHKHPRDSQLPGRVPHYSPRCYKIDRTHACHSVRSSTTPRFRMWEGHMDLGTLPTGTLPLMLESHTQRQSHLIRPHGELGKNRIRDCRCCRRGCGCSCARC